MSGVALLQLVVVALCAIFTLTSIITYQWRRHKARRAAADSKRSNTKIRQLGAREKEILAPWLKDPNRPKRKLTLKDDHLYRLEGEFFVHGVRASGHETYHYQIAGVEVVLPLDAQDHIRAFNSAEVVFAGRYAVVIRLNGTFDLQDAQGRYERLKAQQAQWESGAPGRLKPIHGDDKDQREDPIEQVDILGQRPESPMETEAREGRGHGLIAALAWTGAFIALAVSAGVATDIVRHGTLAAAALLATVALWTFWRPYRRRSRDQVNRVRGPFRAWTVHDPSGQNHSTVQLGLGHQVPFTVPDHWLRSLPYHGGERVEAEIRVKDKSAVRLGEHHSVESEYRRLPPIYWGKHLAVSLPAAGALALALFMTSGMDDRIQDDLHLSKAWLSGQSPSHFPNGQALLDEPPGIGDMVQLSGEAQCQLRRRSGPSTDRFHLDCRHLRLDPDVPELDVAPLPQQALELAESEPLAHRALTRQEQLRTVGRAGRGLNETRLATDPLGLVRDVDQFCMEVANDDSLTTQRCANIKSSILEALQLNTLAPHDSWEEISELADQAYAEDQRAISALLLRADIDRLHSHARSLGQREIARHRHDLAKRLYSAQSGGITIEVRHADDDDLIPEAVPSRDARTHWQALQERATSEGVEPFSIKGLVVDANTDDQGGPHYTIDGSRSLDDPGPALMRSLLVITAVSLLGIHLPLLVMRSVGARRRTARIESMGNPGRTTSV